MRGLDVEPGADERADHRPLVEPEAVDHHQQHPPVRCRAPAAGTRRRCPPRAAAGRSRRRGASGRSCAGGSAAKSCRRLSCSVRSASCRPGSSACPSRTSHSASSATSSTHSRQASGPAAAGLEIAEAGREVARQPLLADPVAVEQPGDDREDLPGIDRLDQIVGDVGADGVLERLGLLALGDHHDRHAVVDGPDGPEQLEPAAAGHLLVEQDDAVRLALEQDQRVVAVGGRLHGEALLFEEEDVRREALDLIVDPENALGAGHGTNIRRSDGRRRRLRPRHHAVRPPHTSPRTFPP